MRIRRDSGLLLIMIDSEIVRVVQSLYLTHTDNLGFPGQIQQQDVLNVSGKGHKMTIYHSSGQRY